MSKLVPWLTLTAVTAVAAVIGASGCATIAVAAAPDKRAETDDRPMTAEADRAFWTTLHEGRYEEIEGVLEQLQRAYLERPNDPRTAAHIAFLHVWRASERARLPTPRATITDDISLARRYFTEASALAPRDPRLKGFLAGMTMAEGNIHHDEKLTRRGFFLMNDAVDEWPEFNLFTRGYVLSQVPVEDPKYTSAVEDQWKTLDLCAGEAIDRKNPNFAPYMAKATTVGWKRACWNSWIAPHNLEGFFLNMGDMIVKAGDAGTARKVYAQAKASPGYATWPFKDLLDRRIAEAEDNVPRFRAPKPEGERQPMVGSAFSCMGCHQER